MKEEEWIKRLYDHAADYEPPVPDDLWEKIEARLPKELVAKKPKARKVSLWVRLTAAAAFVGILAGTTVLLWPKHEETPAASMASVTKESGKTPMESEKSDESEPVCPTVVRMPKSVFTEPIFAESVIAESVIAEADKTEAYNSDEAEVSTNVQSGQPSAESSSTEEKQKTEPSQQMLIRELDEKITDYKVQQKRRVAVSLYASNGFGNLSNFNRVLMSDEMLASYDYDSRLGKTSTRSSDPVYLANYEERQNYYQPISFGLTANFPISSRLSLSSGAVYTRLRSDFTNVADYLVYQNQTTLHYIGIPLNVQYHVWQWHGLNVYATAGGQVDFNVKARLEEDGTVHKMQKDRTQWSVGGALGVQYNIIPQLGLYVEPGVRHYFDNGSRIRNYFKYRPTNFNLQIGLRLQK